jgi:hypothetical protein
MDNIPLCVDLDGTLVLGDTFVASLHSALTSPRPYLLRFPLWLLKGRAFTKQMLARHVLPDFPRLPLNVPLVEYLKAQRAAGRPLILVTGADQAIARGMADHLEGLFTSVLASDGTINLTGRRKAQFLVERYGKHRFDYAGNETRDLAVWAYARRAIVVASGPDLALKAAQVCEVERTFEIGVRG